MYFTGKSEAAIYLLIQCSDLKKFKHKLGPKYLGPIFRYSKDLKIYETARYTWLFIA